MRDIRDIYWVAGLLEGEASFSYVWHRGSMPRISIHMTDFDVLNKLKNITGSDFTIGEVNKRKLDNHPNWKTCYIFNINGKLAVQWMMTIYPLMGERRRYAIRNILFLWKSNSYLNLKEFTDFMESVGSQT